MRLSALAVVATALAACSGSSGGKLSVSTKVTQTGGGAAAPAGAAPDPITVGTHVVTLDRVRILVRKVELSPASSEGMGSGDASGSSDVGTATRAADGSGSGGSAEEADGSDDTQTTFGPFVVDLSGAQLAGPLTLLFDQPVPAGTYEQLEFQVHKLTPGESVADPDFAPLGDSVILALTVDGKPVTFTSGLTAAAEIGGPFTVAAGGTLNVTVTVDPSGWFTAPDGSFLDPGLDANRPAIEQNLRASIRGFEDDDHDGEPDHAS